MPSAADPRRLRRRTELKPSWMRVERMADIIIQARMGSSRLPGKVLRPLGDGSVLGWVVRAARESGVADRIVVATSEAPADDVVADASTDLGTEVHRGSEGDVLARFVGALDGRSPTTTVVRLTADCPLLDPSLIRGCVAAFEGLDVDYLSTTHPRTLPRGLDVEATSAQCLRAADSSATGVDRTHVTSFLYRHPGRFRTAGLTFAPDASDLRVTLDTPEDADAIERTVAELGHHPPAWRDVVRLLRARPDIVAANAEVRQKQLDEG